MSLKHNYIVVEGVIGVGKTSLVQRLHESFNAKPVYEIVEENPFLEKFYKDMKSYAFQTQLFFLLSRYKQQLELHQPDLFYQTIISDYLFAKDKIFARLTMNDAEFGLYNSIYELLYERIPQPDLVIYLQASTDRLMQNIGERGRKFEEDISREYIESLNNAYREFFFQYSETSLLVINTEEIDFVHIDTDFQHIVREIQNMKHGVRYVHPVGSRRPLVLQEINHQSKGETDNDD